MTARSNLSPIVAGTVEAKVLKLDAPISFWGNIDNLSGRIVDRSHPQFGLVVTRCCVVVPMIRGSGGTPGTLAFLLKQGLGPAGIVAGKPDINVMTGVVVAHQLYGIACPFYLANAAQMAGLLSGGTITIDANGCYEFGVVDA